MSGNDPQASDLLVITSADAAALESAISRLLEAAQRIDTGEYIVQDEFVKALKLVAAFRNQTRPVLHSLHHVPASGVDAEDPILAVLPPHLTAQNASEIFGQAVMRAQAVSADGEGTPYFEALQESLAASGIQITGEVINLDGGPWDVSAVIPPEPNANDLMDDDPQWVKVRIHGPALYDSDDDWDMALEDGSPVEFVEGEQPFIGFVRSLTYRFPRGDRYGIPEAATESGARNFIADELGFACSRDLVVYGVDTGDDSIPEFAAECIMPRDILRPIVKQEEREHG